VGLTTLLETFNLNELVKDILNPVCKSCPQLATDSQLFQDLNREQEAYPNIKYLMLVSKYVQFATFVQKSTTRRLESTLISLPILFSSLSLSLSPQSLTGMTK